MVEYRFDLKSLFKDRITKVTPQLFVTDDKRKIAELSPKLCQVINDLGNLSARAQNLKTPITTLDRLRQSNDQSIYILSDLKSTENGKILGFLKVGFKDLYLFDMRGRNRHMKHSPAILDFYVHETLQRKGFGKEIFDFMLADQKLEPFKYCVDRPSSKMLAFLSKYYKLAEPIPQSNNFVLYKGFFEDDIDISPPKPAFRRCCALDQIQSQTQLSPIGRYGARNFCHTRSSIFQ